MTDVVFLNGRFVPRPEATVSIDDRGFLFGDAVYEVVRVARGSFVEAERHLQRLERSLREIAIPPPRLEPLGVAKELLGRNGLTQGDAVVYLQVSRGAAQRQHAFPSPPVPPTVLMTAAPFQPRPELAERGVAVITQPDLRWSRCDIKSVNLLPNVLAAERAAEAGAFEAILLRDRVVTEATRSNVFALLGGVIRTHPTGPLILPGVTREVVLELAAEAGLSVSEEAVTSAELARADEVFVTGTTSDVMPIVSIDGRRVGSGRPGPVTTQLGQLLAQRIEAGVPA
jgi:D-alanine transaminase